MTAKPKSSPDKELVRAFEAGGVLEYLEYIQSGKRILWVNFRAGIARALGATVGVALVLGLLVWVLTMLVDLPVVGEYFEETKRYVNEYAENTNYTDEFAEMNRLLTEINDNLKPPESQPSD